MKIALIVSSAWLKKRHFDPKTPISFDEHEKTFAKEHGVIVQKRFSKTRGEYYQANVCPHCNAFIGEHFLIDYIMNLFYDDGNKNSSMFEKVKMGWFCPKCEMGIEEGE